jgi:hypothetical protein
MTGRVLNFTRSPHQGAVELLPWYVNGTLEHDEAALVEQHLPGCAACRAELESLRLLQAAYVEAASDADADAALARLLPRLDGERAAGAGRGGRSAVAYPARLVDLARGAWRRRGVQVMAPAWIKFAVAMQFAVIFALGWKVAGVDRTVREDQLYHTLSSGSTAARANGSIVVVFDPAVPQRELLRILKDCGARIVDGPTATNAFVLALEPGAAHSGTADALARLRAEHAVVLAEPLQSETADAPSAGPAGPR